MTEQALREPREQERKPMSAKSKSQEIHARLGHQVIDSDGHWREFEPIAMDYLKETAAAKPVERWYSRLRGLGEADFATITPHHNPDRPARQPPCAALPATHP